MVDQMRDEVNTSTRWSHYCRAVSKDGRKCTLYAPHDGKHMPNHGIDKDLFGDDE